MHHTYHNVSVVQALAPVNATSSQASPAIDLQGFGAATMAFATGVSADTLNGSVYWTLKLQHSDASGSGYEDLASGDAVGGTTSIVIDAMNKDETVYRIGYIGSKRYLKAVITATGSHSSGMPVAVVALRAPAGYAPVA